MGSLAGAAAVAVGALTPSTLLVAQTPGQAGCAAARRFESFSDLRNEVLDYLSGATQRVWLVTPYLTDGEIVSALYVAQYRKLDVKVLLGRAKANSYMSRLSYLKNQNVPVFLKPDTFAPPQPTVILADERVVLIDGELDFLAKYRRFNCQEGRAADAANFVKQFASAANLQVPAIAAPAPLVGGSGPQRSNLKVIRSQGQGPGVNQDGSYTYGYSRTPKPADLPAKLPKTTIWQERAADKAASEAAQKAVPKVPPSPPSAPRAALHPGAAPPENEPPMLDEIDISTPVPAAAPAAP